MGDQGQPRCAAKIRVQVNLEDDTAPIVEDPEHLELDGTIRRQALLKVPAAKEGKDRILDHVPSIDLAGRTALLQHDRSYPAPREGVRYRESGDAAPCDDDVAQMGLPDRSARAIADPCDHRGSQRRVVETYRA